jgi:hypothetical protein
VSSTKRTTFANPTLEAAALIAVALMAMGAVVLSVRDARAAYVRALGVEAAEQAEMMERGPARDRMLDRAQERLHDALDVYERDPALWRAMARTRYLQATGAEVREVSSTLLEAAVEAARHAEALDPLDHEAPGRIAQAMSLMANGDRNLAAEALARSYLRRGPDPVAGVWRLESASRLWDVLGAEGRQAALAEACLIARQSTRARTETEAAIAASADMSAAFAAIRQDSGCAPDASIQNQDS